MRFADPPYPLLHIHLRLPVVPLSLSPSCVTRKKLTERKKWPRELPGVHAAIFPLRTKRRREHSYLSTTLQGNLTIGMKRMITQECQIHILPPSPRVFGHVYKRQKPKKTMRSPFAPRFLIPSPLNDCHASY